MLLILQASNQHFVSNILIRRTINKGTVFVGKFISKMPSLYLPIVLGSAIESHQLPWSHLIRSDKVLPKLSFSTVS